MDVSTYVTEMLPVVGTLLATTVLASILALVYIGLQIGGKQIHSVLGTVVILPVVSALIWFSGRASMDFRSAEPVDAQQMSALYQWVGSEMFGLFFVALPILILAVGCAMGALRHDGRRWKIAVVGSLCCMSVGVACILLCFFLEAALVPAAILRGLFFIAVGIPAGLSFAAWRSDSDAVKQLPVAASIAFVWLVAMGEVQGRGIIGFQFIGYLFDASPTDRIATVGVTESFLFSKARIVAMCSMSISLAIAGFAIFGAWLGASGRNRGFLLLAGVWMAAAPAFYYFAGPSQADWEYSANRTKTEKMPRK
jgi:hypothetical protein